MGYGHAVVTHQLFAFEEGVFAPPLGKEASGVFFVVVVVVVEVLLVFFFVRKGTRGVRFPLKRVFKITKPVTGCARWAKRRPESEETDPPVLWMTCVPLLRLSLHVYHFVCHFSCSFFLSAITPVHCSVEVKTGPKLECVTIKQIIIFVISVPVGGARGLMPVHGSNQMKPAPQCEWTWGSSPTNWNFISSYEPPL